MVKRKRFFHKHQTVDSESTDTEEISETVQPPEENIQTKKEKKRIENTSTSSLKPTGIVKYVYLIVFLHFLLELWHQSSTQLKPARLLRTAL